MKKKVCVRVVAMVLCAVLFVACGAKSAEPTIGAGDYSNELFAQLAGLDLKNLSEISTRVIGTPKEDFYNLADYQG